MSRWQDRLRTLLDVHPGEGQLVGLVLAYAILLYASNVLARTASYALFLTTFDAATLSFAYVGISIAAPLAAAVYLRLNQRHALSTVLVAVHVFLLVTLAVYALALNVRPAPWLLFSLPIYFGVNNSLAISSFWNLLGRIYNLQQGKRLFGLLSSGEHIATIAAGFIAPLLITAVGTSNLLWIAAVLMALTLAVLMVIFRRNAEKLSDAESETADEPRQPISSLFASRYVRLIVALFALFIVGAYFVDNLFYDQAELRYANEGELAGFLALFSGVYGALSLFVQIFVAGRVLTRFGVRAMLMATPLGLLVFMVPFALMGALNVSTAALFWLIVIAAMYRSVLDAVDSAAVNVMYQPLPSHQRTQAQTVVTGIVYPLSIGVAGLLLLFLTEVLGFPSMAWAYLLLAILVVWLWTAVKLGRAYPRQLQQALRQRMFRGGRSLHLDELSLDVVRQGLTSPHVGVVLYALDTLAATNPEEMGEVLPELLEHPRPEIRQEALRRMEGLGLVEALPAVRRRLRAEASPAVRATALRLVATLDEAGAIDEVLPYLEDEDAHVRQEVMVGLLRNTEHEICAEACRRLIALSSSAEAADRMLAAHIIGQSGNPEWRELLKTLLGDADVHVRRAALTAAGHAAYAPSWPSVIAALAARETRRAAAAALVKGGEAVMPSIQSAFDRPDQDAEVRRQLAHISGRIGGEASATFLRDHLHDRDDGVRAEVLAALFQCDYHVAARQQTPILKQITYEAEQAAKVVAILADLQKGDDPEDQYVLLSALKDQLTRFKENIIYLLSFVYAPQTIMRAWEALRPSAQADEEQRAYALEALDVTLSKEIKTFLLPLMGDLALPAQRDRLNGVFPQPTRSPNQRLAALLDSPTLALQLSAAYRVGQLGLSDEAVRRDLSKLALAAPGPLAREAASWALSRLEVEAVDRQLAEAGDPGAALVSSQVEARRDGRDVSLPAIARVDSLRRARLFSDSTVETLLDVAAQMSEVHCEAGGAVFAKGDEGDSMYMVVTGVVRIHDGQRTLNDLGATDVFGEMALLESAPRLASATAVEATHLLRLDRDTFHELLSISPDISRGVIRVLSHFLRASVRAIDLHPAAQDESPDAMTELQEAQAYQTAPLTPVEGMLLLKRVEMFRQLPDELLTELVFLLKEVVVAKGETVFEIGAPGDALFVVARGKVRVHTPSRTLNYLEEGMVFGEMALLDPEPRMASVTAVAPTRLLRLDQASFNELLEDRAELAEGIIHNLSGHLRNRARDLTELQSR